ncbi:hypothetical protein E2C01_100216 [Portunus trituberculatus]|uniref:Uncharacterized protein n=1 Tax=Portunus trituberculatus TaxID=210409 RepID=A0A5B7K2F6_PORTR|nr:hypothetical protein [Portunus trituberculatus]
MKNIIILFYLNPTPAPLDPAQPRQVPPSHAESQSDPPNTRPSVLVFSERDEN